MVSLSLQKTNVIGEISKEIYSFLPNKPHPYADQSISFKGVADDMGVSDYWRNGSKLPAIRSILENTFEYRRDIFCSLIVEIVRKSIKYRDNKNEPITREAIERINNLILKIEFKIPELWDESFLASLPSEPQNNSESEIKKCEKSTIDYNELLNLFLYIQDYSPQKRGFEFERFLTIFFDAFGLKPNPSFRLKGEQIDGSIEFENNIYLVEAKWQTGPTGNSDLLIFRGKVENKSTWSRGLFISINGFSEDGLDAFSRGKATNIIAISGHDIYYILNNEIRLSEVIKRKLRKTAETGIIYVPVSDLF